MHLVMAYSIFAVGLLWLWLLDFDKTSETIPLPNNLGEVIVIDPLVQSLQDKINFETKDETQFSKIPFHRTFLGTINAGHMEVGIIGVTKENIYYLCKKTLGPFSLRDKLFQRIGTIQVKDDRAEISLERIPSYSILVSIIILFLSFFFGARVWER